MCVKILDLLDRSLHTENNSRLILGKTWFQRVHAMTQATLGLEKKRQHIHNETDEQTFIESLYLYGRHYNLYIELKNNTNLYIKLKNNTDGDLAFYCLQIKPILLAHKFFMKKKSDTYIQLLYLF